jgi:hypothetical protein
MQGMRSSSRIYAVRKGGSHRSRFDVATTRLGPGGAIGQRYLAISPGRPRNAAISESRILTGTIAEGNPVNVNRCNAYRVSQAIHVQDDRAFGK